MDIKRVREGMIFVFFGILICFSSSSVSAADLFYTPFADKTINNHARSVNQLSQGVYDPAAKKTFITYPAGTLKDQSGNEKSAVLPYVVAYDHQTAVWSKPVPFITEGYNDVSGDAHNYSQIILDRDGYIHIFHFFHGFSFVHIQANKPHTIDGGWVVKRSSDYPELVNPYGSPGTLPLKAAYGKALTAANGDIYLFFRNTSLQPSASDPDAAKKWFEPWYYAKSTDNGKTWTQRPLIEPTQNADGYNTIYVRAMKYSSSPEGIHILFEPTYNHSQYYKTEYYVFFSFVDNRMYAADGTVMSTPVTRSVYEEKGVLFSYDQRMDNGLNGTTSIVVDTDQNKRPIIFYTKYYPGNTPWVGDLWQARRNSQNNKWIHTQLSAFGKVVGPQDIEYRSENDIDMIVRLYQNSESLPTYMYHYNGLSWSKTNQLLVQSSSNIRSVGSAAYITNYNPELMGTYLAEKSGPWYNPQPIGTYHTFGTKRLVSSLLPMPTRVPTMSSSFLPRITTSPPPLQPSPTIQDIFGDFNKDGSVNDADFNILKTNLGKRECGNIADLDKNCMVNIFDLNILLESINK